MSVEADFESGNSGAAAGGGVFGKIKRARKKLIAI